MQRLILPIPNCAFSASYKNRFYFYQMKYNHYGVDLYALDGDKTVYACGDGEVIACGMDGKTRNSGLGLCIVIIYRNVWSHEGQLRNLACRMFHFDTINVKVGDKVTRDTIIGTYGNTGGVRMAGKPMGEHLHIEFDTDIDFPTYAYGIKTSGNVIKRDLVDTTVNPTDYWNLGPNQTIEGIYEGWFMPADIDLPRIEQFPKA